MMLDTPLLTRKQIQRLARKVPSWSVINRRKLFKKFKFKDFRRSMSFVNKVAGIAEREDHHPDIHIFYNVVRLETWTHTIKGLSKKDFALAAKIDAMLHTTKTPPR